MPKNNKRQSSSNANGCYRSIRSDIAIESRSSDTFLRKVSFEASDEGTLKRVSLRRPLPSYSLSSMGSMTNQLQLSPSSSSTGSANSSSSPPPLSPQPQCWGQFVDVIPNDLEDSSMPYYSFRTKNSSNTFSCQPYHLKKINPKLRFSLSRGRFFPDIVLANPSENPLQESSSKTTPTMRRCSLSTRDIMGALKDFSLV